MKKKVAIIGAILAVILVGVYLFNNNTISSNTITETEIREICDDYDKIKKAGQVLVVFDNIGADNLEESDIVILIKVDEENPPISAIFATDSDINSGGIPVGKYKIASDFIDEDVDVKINRKNQCVFITCDYNNDKIIVETKTIV